MAEDSHEASSSKGILEKTLDAFMTLTKGLPMWVRAVIVVLALVIAGGVAAYHYRPEPKAEPKQASTATATVIVETAAAGQQYVNGQPDPNHPLGNNPQIIEANHKAAEDNAAYTYHFNGEAKIPDVQSIGTDIDKNNFLHYRYFEATDKCLYVNRREKGVDHYQWLRDPDHHEHDIDKQRDAKREPSKPIFVEPPQSRISKIFEQLLPTARASIQFDPPVTSEAAAQPNYCVNPHPGPFQYWWGAPFDQCNTPMYRRFGDGCTHYQVYNRCSNSWDGRIFWTYCHPPPHS